MNTHTWKNRALAAVLGGTTAIAGAGSASAAPVLTSTAALKRAQPSDVQNVRWGWGGAFFGGLVAGGLIGAAIARPYYGYGYGYGYYGYPSYAYGGYPYGYGYSYPYYSYGYGYPYGGYYGGYYGGWRGYGWRGNGWRGYGWRHHVRHR